ncbi:MAG TPA: hypothetical protein VMF06_10515, partial [Candidatus Limnocylindria bacterium]|nr:hypothetical protein [Candidatus Limnocylindria bacterium]
MKLNTLLGMILCGLSLLVSGRAQSLINIDFGGSSVSAERGAAGTGQGTNDFWNPYTHYTPRFTPGMAEVANGLLRDLKFADGTASKVAVAVTNAPGVWGNASGDTMLDSFIFGANGSNIVVTITGLEPGRYHLYAYGHADADGGPEQNSIFSVRVGDAGPRFGPLAVSSTAGWRAGQPWQEGRHYVVFRDVNVRVGEALILEVAPGAGGIATLNGLQIFSRGTAPPRLTPGEVPAGSLAVTNLLFREIRYEGSVAGLDAKIQAIVDVESLSTNELSAVLFEGDLALLAPTLPNGWRIVPDGKRFILTASLPGAQRIELSIRAKVIRRDPWNEISFNGPSAAIGAIAMSPAAPGPEIHFTTGTELEASRDSGSNQAAIKGVLASDGKVGIRWQSQTAEVNRESVVSGDTRVAARLTPSVAHYTSTLRFDVIQGRLTRARVALPPEHALTKVSGEVVRDWRVDATPEGPILTVEFLRSIEKTATLVLLTEVAVPPLPTALVLSVPQPLGLQRETGRWSLAEEDVVAKVESFAGLRQVDGEKGETAAFQFAARPASIRISLGRVTPVVTVADRVGVRLEDTRLRIGHRLTLAIEKAGLYSVETEVPAGFTVAELAGDGVDDWRVTTNRLKIDFSRRAIGGVKLSILLEKALTNLPPEIVVDPLRITGAEKESAMIGASAAPGLTLKTGSMTRAREIPAGSLPDRGDDVLGYRADIGDWKITLAAERPPARVVAEIFDLVTVGDGLVGGSATLRYAIINQGLQAFRVRVPAHWRNVEFIGANIRRTDHETNLWTVSLQDKAWDAYTLVVTYDYPFDANKAVLDAGGAHPLGVERETGTLAVTAASGLEVKAGAFVEPLRPIDPTELSQVDRTLITRQVVLAGRYEGTAFDLKLEVTRHEQLKVLDAIADRAELRSVVTDQGEMLTQASFMVKNNDRQYQRFLLPNGATLWGVAVDGEPVKADRDGDWVLVSLPRNVDRDRAFAVDLTYAQQMEPFKRSGGFWPRSVELRAPSTDVPGTYAEWEIYAPTSQHLDGFGGNMVAARGTTYGLHEAWGRFTRYYSEFWHNYAAQLVFGTVAGALLLGMVRAVRKGGFRGFAQVMAVGAVAFILAGMLLPALSKAKSRAQRINSVNNLKNIGLALRTFAGEHDGKYPQSLDEVRSEIGSEKILRHPDTGEYYIYLGAGHTELEPTTIMAYGSSVNGRIEVLLGDGSVQQISSDSLGKMLASQQAQLVASATNVMEGKEQTDGALRRRYSSLSPMGGGFRGKVEAALDAKSETKDMPEPSAPPIQAAPVTSAGITGAQGAPTAVGLRSLKIEIPKSGRHFAFTRTLNLSGQPAAIRLQVMSSKSFVILRSLFQASTFVAGILLIWLQGRRASPQAFWSAVGWSLALVGAVSLFVAWEVLHLFLIALVPLVGLIAMAWVLKRVIGPWLKTTPAIEPPPVPASVATLLLLGWFLIPIPKLQAAVSPVVRPLSITSAQFVGEAGERSAVFDVTLELSATGTNQTTALFGKDVGLQEFTVGKGDARLWREGDSVGVLMPMPGAATIKLKLIAKVGG